MLIKRENDSLARAQRLLLGEEISYFFRDSERIRFYLQNNENFQNFTTENNFPSQIKSVKPFTNEEGQNVLGAVFKYDVEFDDDQRTTVYAKKYTAFPPALRDYYENQINPNTRLTQERRAIELLGELNIPELKVPQIIFVDAQRKILVTSEIPGSEKAKPISFDIESGGEQSLAEILAMIHGKTWHEGEEITEEERTMFLTIWKFRAAGAIKEYPQMARSVELFLDDSLAHSSSFIHGDLSTRNSRIGSNGLNFFDFELSQKKGDPASDVGFFLAHALREILINPDSKKRVVGQAIKFWDCYRDKIKQLVPDLDVEAFEKRVTGFMSLGLFYRVYFTPSMPMNPKDVEDGLISASAIFDKNTVLEALEEII